MASRARANVLSKLAIAESNQCAVPTIAAYGPTHQFVARGGAYTSQVSHKLLEYARYEAKVRGVPVEEVMQEELHAMETARALWPSRERLSEMASVDHSYSDMGVDETCPF